jgi:hypothetical protein
MMKKIVAFLLLYAVAICFGQTYKPIDTADYLKRKEFLKSFAANNENLITKSKNTYSGKKGSELSKIYKDLEKDFEKQVKNKDFVFNSVFEGKVKNLIGRLKRIILRFHRI